MTLDRPDARFPWDTEFTIKRRSKWAEYGPLSANNSMLGAALLFEGYVGKDYEELIFVLITMAISFGIMVALGAWWSR